MLSLQLTWTWINRLSIAGAKSWINSAELKGDNATWRRFFMGFRSVLHFIYKIKSIELIMSSQFEGKCARWFKESFQKLTSTHKNCLFFTHLSAPPVQTSWLSSKSELVQKSKWNTRSSELEGNVSVVASVGVDRLLGCVDWWKGVIRRHLRFETFNGEESQETAAEIWICFREILHRMVR